MIVTQILMFQIDSEILPESDAHGRDGYYDLCDRDEESDARESKPDVPDWDYDICDRE